MPSQTSKYDRTPPPDNPAVAAIMAERGIGRRRAYLLHKREQAKTIDTSDVQPSQRVAVMAVLINHPDTKRDTQKLVAGLHAMGVKIDGHDAVKTLWALQKQGWVGFRQRSRGGIYAITIKEAGYAGFPALVNGRATDKYFETGLTIDAEKAVEEQRAVEHAVTHTILEPVEETAPSGDFPDEPPYILGDDLVTRAYTGLDLDLDFPHIASLMQRAEKVDKLNAAAAILDEIGETDLAVAIYDKAGLSTLEREVIDLVRKVI